MEANPPAPEPSVAARLAAPRAHAEGVRAMFDRIAPRYDLLNRLVSAGMDQRWRRRVLGEVRRGPRGACLDLCAGTLDLAALLAGAFPSERVVAVDLAEEMMRAGRKKAPRVETVVGDVCALPFSGGEFAAATCGFGVRNVADVDAFAREALRVLRPGGRLVVLEAFHPERRVGALLHRAYMGHVFPALGALVVRDRAPYDYFVKSVGAFLSRREFERLLERAGFRAVRGYDVHFGLAGVVVGEKA